MTPVNAQTFAKAGPAGGASQPVPNGQPASTPAQSAAAPVAAQTHPDPTQNGSFGMDNGPQMVTIFSLP
jgi:hypothetical protein